MFSVLSSPVRSLYICALKFTKSILAVKDDFYHRHIVKFDLFKPIFDLLAKTSKHDNLVTSVIVDIVEFVRYIFTYMCRYLSLSI